MVVVLIILGAIQILGVAIVLITAARAPTGYEDEAGFHKAEPDPPPVHPPGAAPAEPQSNAGSP